MFFRAFVLVLVWLFLIPMTYGIALVAGPLAYWLLVFRGSEARAQTADAKLNSTLIQGENVVTTGIQKRIAALLSRRLLVAITSSRIIVISRGWFGGFEMHDYQWKDLRDARLSENIFPGLCGSNLVFAVSNGPALNIAALPSNVASQIYSHAQAQEQEWEEKRRIRSIEETRAAAGGVTIHQGAAPAAVPAAAGGETLVTQLKNLKELFEQGHLSDVEFNAAKAKLLAG